MPVSTDSKPRDFEVEPSFGSSSDEIGMIRMVEEGPQVDEDGSRRPLVGSVEFSVERLSPDSVNSTMLEQRLCGRATRGDAGQGKAQSDGLLLLASE